MQHRRVLAGHHGGDGDASAGMESEEDIDDDTTEIDWQRLPVGCDDCASKHVTEWARANGCPEPEDSDEEDDDKRTRS